MTTKTLYVTRNDIWYQLYETKPVFVNTCRGALSGRRIVNWDRTYDWDLCIDEFQSILGLKRLLITKKQEAQNHITTIKVIVPGATQ